MLKIVWRLERYHSQVLLVAPNCEVQSWAQKLSWYPSSLPLVDQALTIDPDSEFGKSSQMYFLTLMIQRPLPDTPDDDILAGHKASANINPLGRSSVIPEGQ